MSEGPELKPTVADRGNFMQDLHNRIKKRELIVGIGASVLILGTYCYATQDNGPEKADEPASSASASPSRTKQADTFQFTGKDGRNWNCTIDPLQYTVRKGDTLSEIVQNHQTPETTKGQGVLQEETKATAAYNKIKLNEIINPGDKISTAKCTSNQLKPTPTQ